MSQDNREYINLSHLPTEIHHVIFTYLDYIHDICCDQLLFVPHIEMPLTCKEFEENAFGRAEEFVDFDHPNVVPFFLACKSLMKSVKSFRPTQLNITTFLSERRLSRYNIDMRYRELLNPFAWFKPDANVVYPISHREWLGQVVELLDKMKRFCKANPFKDVEFISVYEWVGRNYSSSPSYFFRSDLEKLVRLLPSVKYVLCGHQGFQMQNILKERSLVIVNAFTAERYSQSGLVYQNNTYSTLGGAQEFIGTERLKDAFPNNYSRAIEVFLFNSLICSNFTESYKIIDNFRLNINYFSFIWNVKCDIVYDIKYDKLVTIMEILNAIYERYPSFRVFRIPIDSVEALKLILTYPFVDIIVGKNITKTFLASIQPDEVQTLSRDYNIDFSKLGNYKFSAACFTEASKLQLDPNTCDQIFGVTPQMINPGQGGNLNTKDKFGNNLLHYGYTARKKMDHISDEELQKLEIEENIFGVTPKEIAIIYRYDDRSIANFSKKFNYEGLKRMVYYDSATLILLDGLMVDARILYATNGSIFNTSYDYKDYEDANYRDLNGKHLYHYSPSTRIVETHFGMSPVDTLLGRDSNQTIPIQLNRNSYLYVMNQLTRIDSLPKMNFISYSDNFGMYRFQYLMINNYFNTFMMVNEAESIAFDYSSGQPELVSLSFHYTGGLSYFSIEKSPLQQLRNINLFGTVDGDDFSHYVLRNYIDCIKRMPQSCVDHSILTVLMARGLKFDVVRNSKGQTAFDLLEEITKLPNTPRLLHLFNDLKKVCKRGLTTKSRALPKFSIRYTNIPDNLIVEKSETTLVISTADILNNYRIRIKRNLYFEKKDINTK